MRRASATVLVAVLAAGCGTTAFRGSVRSAATVVTCLHSLHVSAQIFPGGVKQLAGGDRSVRAIVTLGPGFNYADITLYASRGAAARAFARHSGSEPELGDGNAIATLTGYPLPPGSGKATMLGRCAFGPGATPVQSAFYRQVSAHPLTGRSVMLRSGCLACHVIGDQGNNGPGPPLTRIGARLSAAAIARALVAPAAPMPSFRAIRQSDPAAFRALVSYLTGLR